MSTIIYSHAFAASTITAAFDELITRDAASGRVPNAFIMAMAADYGYELPASPAKAVKAINVVLAEPSMLQFTTGSGSQVKNRVITRTLHALGEALHAGAAKGLPMLLALPTWAADPAPKAKTPKAAKPVIEADTAPDVGTDAATPEAKAPTLAASVNLIVAAAKGGMLTSAQIDVLRTVLATAQAAPVTARGARKAAAAKVAPAVGVDGAGAGVEGDVAGVGVDASEKAAILDPIAA